MSDGKWLSGRDKGVDEMACFGAQAERRMAEKLASKVPARDKHEPRPSGPSAMGWRN